MQKIESAGRGMDSTFPFLGLPSEIRIQIYEWAVLQPQKVKTGPSYEESKQLKNIRGYGHGPYGQPAITQTSRLIRMESVPVFYKLRRFPLLSSPYQVRPTRRLRVRPPVPHAWIGKIEPANIKLMKSFALELQIPHHRDCDEIVRCILSIDVKGASYDLWLGTSWGDNRFTPLDKYWNRVMTRENGGVGPVMDRLSVVLSDMRGEANREDLERLIEAMVGGPAT